ncbi:Transposase [Mycolicibacterium rutilum]|uniref:Transposase n=1 Tax=Mycolicibacterium rutilum TaxID=370526 RepID=A0A1H6K310_MYCRU|nr:IS110 family transposase [Mycolicibacterium rutilum]SEH69652.1 Transposase [Mycolicibacterium rutilum]
MIVIGVDPHKSTHTATALDPSTNSDLGSLRIEASVADYERLIGWAKVWPERTWAIENADGLGHHLALWLLARGEVVLDVSATATARVRELSRGGRRKNDRIDAAAAASVAALQGDARPVHSETTTDSLALLDERRVNLSQHRTRTINQLHALLRELIAGGVPTSLTPAKATTALRGLRPRTGTDRVRLELAKDLIADVRRLDDQLAANAAKESALLEEHGTRLQQIDGVGPILAARILGRTGSAARFASAAAYANYTGTAPVQVASADSSQHRLSRYGDRQLNCAIHTIAMVQIRMPASTGRAFYDKKIAQGKPPRHATRALKRHLAAHLWRVMHADELRITGRPPTTIQKAS